MSNAPQQRKKNKEIKISMGIATGDLDTKLRNLVKLANKGHLVKLTLQIKGRHKSRPGDANEFFDEVLKLIADEVASAGSKSISPHGVSLMLKAKNPPKKEDSGEPSRPN